MKAGSSFDAAVAIGHLKVRVFINTAARTLCTLKRVRRMLQALYSV